MSWSFQPAAGRIALVAAAADGKLVAKVTQSGFDTVVRFDATGQATFDTWTASTVDYAFGNLWLAKGSTIALSAAPVPWAFSIWARPSGEQHLAGPTPKIELRAAQVNDQNHVLSLNEASATAAIKAAITFWQQKADILVAWDGKIPSVPACDPIDCSKDNSIFADTDATDDRNILTRFNNPKGVQLLFLVSVRGKPGDALTLIQFNSTGQFVKFTNVMSIGLVASDAIVHELGHGFQLQHVGLSPFNLMCGSLGDPVDNVLSPIVCTNFLAKGLSNNQIIDARTNARALQ